jgi:hypothetical protein
LNSTSGLSIAQIERFATAHGLAFATRDQAIEATLTDGGPSEPFEGPLIIWIDASANSLCFNLFPFSYGELDERNTNYRALVELNGATPLVKVMVDDDRNVVIAVELPTSAVSHESFGASLSGLLAFIREQYPKLSGAVSLYERSS